MFQLDGSLIQVGFGEKALQAVSTKDSRDLFDVLAEKEPPGWADNLLQTTSSLLKKLRTEGFIVSDNVLFVSAPQLPPYYAWERDPKLSVLIALADYFDVSPDYLVGRSDVAKRR